MNLVFHLPVTKLISVSPPWDGLADKGNNLLCDVIKRQNVF